MIQEALNSVADAASLQGRLKAYYQSQGYEWDTVNLIGVRGTDDFYTNKFLCRLAIITDDKAIIGEATTVPGPYWTPENCKKLGIAYAEIIVPGFYKNVFGYTNHHGHPKGMAFGQRGNFKCFRDLDRDSKMNEKPYTQGPSAGDNMHTQMEGDTDNKVNFASAGCQVWRSRKLFLEQVMPLAKSIKQGDSARFNYLLTECETFPFWKEFLELTDTTI